MREARLGSIVIAALAAFTLGAGYPGSPAASETKPATGQVVDGAKKIGKGAEEAATGIGRTVTEAAKEVGREAEPAADRVHDSAKGFGEALWDGMKSVGRAIGRALSGSR